LLLSFLRHTTVTFSLAPFLAVTAIFITLRGPPSPYKNKFSNRNCCRKPPIHNNNPQTGKATVFCFLNWMQAAGWLWPFLQADTYFFLNTLSSTFSPIQLKKSITQKGPKKKPKTISLFWVAA